MPEHLPERDSTDIMASYYLAQTLDQKYPLLDPAGWQVSVTGTVWTEIVAYEGTRRERRTQVIALSEDIFLLVLPLTDVSGLYRVEVFNTFKNACLYFTWTIGPSSGG